MAKDVRRAMEATRLQAQHRPQPADVQVVSEGYRKTFTARELREIEAQRQALRARLFAAS